MPFIALDRETRERIDITRITSPREELKSGNVLCQLCEEPMIVKAGLIVAPHFAHYQACESDYITAPESAEHRQAKRQLVCKLRELFAEYTNAEIELEVPIPEIRRVADVLATFPMGWRVAHEIQLASITTENLKDRTNDYSRAGIDVTWWLGQNANTPANRAWCVRTFGFSLSISVSIEDEVELLGEETEPRGWQLEDVAC